MDSKIVKSWFSKAGKDLRTAKALFSLGEDFFENSAYHSEQCAEKSIKGFLAANKKIFKKSHDIGYLLELVNTFDSQLSQNFASAKSLTKYAIAVRYPDANEDIEINESRAKEALKTAEDIYAEFSKRALV